MLHVGVRFCACPGGYVATVIVVVINQVLKQGIKRSASFARAHTVEEEMVATSMRVYACQLLNTAILMLLLKSNLGGEKLIGALLVSVIKLKDVPLRVVVCHFGQVDKGVEARLEAAQLGRRRVQQLRHVLKDPNVERLLHRPAAQPEVRGEELQRAQPARVGTFQPWRCSRRAVSPSRRTRSRRGDGTTAWVRNRPCTGRRAPRIASRGRGAQSHAARSTPPGPQRARRHRR